MGRLRRLAPLKVEIFHGEADDFTGRLQAVTITSRFDLRDEIQGEIKRQWGRTFLCASGHNSKAAGSSRSWALEPAHTDLRRGQRKFLRNGNFDAGNGVQGDRPSPLFRESERRVLHFCPSRELAVPGAGDPSPDTPPEALT